MSPRERHYIEHAVSQAGGHGHKDTNDNSPLTTSIPLRAILRSPAVWAIAVAQIGSDWLYYLLITVMPNFMEEVMHMSHTTITLLTGLPLLAIIPSIYVAGSLSDFLRRKNIMSTTAVRKTGDFLCKIFPGAILICLSHLGPGDVVWFVVLYVLACCLLAFIYTSWITNPVDLSPAYTGFITSLCETASMWIAIVVPIIVENITSDKLVSQWQLVFYITGGLQVVTFLFYLAFGSSLLQPWGRPDSAPHGDVITTTENTDDDYLAGGSYVRRKKLRRSLSCPYSSDGEIGRLRTYRAPRSVLSDTEEDNTTSWFNAPGKSKPSHVNNFSQAPVYNSVYYTTSSTSASEERHKPLTSNTDTSYVTMYGSASAYDTAEDEDLYESMDLDRTPLLANGCPRPTAKNAVYENVLVGPAINDSHDAKAK
ncbi:hypothetical protein V1264_007021 [Littorina saxatilis]|uniref:Uncharacterized protein n=2 Tax=Littorina saxatilis TaxID=31220 RepID=A0AAN9AUJ9_9CAEN